MIAKLTEPLNPAPLGRSGEDELGLSAIPSPRLGPRLRRWLGGAIVLQCTLGAAALVILNGQWLSQSRTSSLKTMAGLVGDRLAGQVLHPQNPLAKKALHSIVSLEGIRFAVVVDQENRVVLSDGDRKAMPIELNAEPGTQLKISARDLDRITTFGATEIITASMGGDRQHRVIVGISNQSTTLGVANGLLALVAGSIGSLAIIIPLSWLRARRSARTLHDLHKGIRRLAKGVAPDPLALAGDEEVAFLGAAFNSMAGDILATQQALQTANATLEQRVAERTDELRQANAALERNNITLADVTNTALRFTDDVAHEFRTPLAVILEIAAVIEDGLVGGVTPQQRQHLSFIKEAGKDMSNLVDDFLDTSRLRAGRLPVHRRPHSVADLLDAAWKMLEVKASDRAVTLRRTVPADLPLVLADIDKVRRILINLVVNAIKFSHAGNEVRVVADASADSVAIHVIDQGPGMSEEEVSKLFERFRQTSTGLRGATKGFGLGLSITSELVAIGLGEISVTSAVGKGSTFTFTLPKHEVLPILKHCLARAQERGPNVRIGALIVRPGLNNASTATQICDQLGDLMQPQDVLLPCENDRSVVVIGAADDISSWRDRFLPTEPPDQSEASLAIEVAGYWPIEKVSAQELAQLIKSVTRLEERHA